MSLIFSRRESALGIISCLLTNIGNSYGNEFRRGLHSKSSGDIQDSIDALYRIGGGNLIIDKGTYHIGKRSKKGLVIHPGVNLIGSGDFQTKLIMSNEAKGNAVIIKDGHANISNLIIDGNCNNKPFNYGHNLRINGDKVNINNFISINSCGYGVAIAQKGSATNVSCRNISIVNTKLDGIDIKNIGNKTKKISLTNVNIRDFGRNGSFAVKAKAGIDIRSEVILNNIKVFGVKPGQDGIRFRPGGADNINGPGAHYSSLDNCYISGDLESGGGNGIAVLSNNIIIKRSVIENTSVGLFVVSNNCQFENGEIRDVNNFCVVVNSDKLCQSSSISISQSKLSGYRIFLASCDYDILVKHSDIFGCLNLQHINNEDKRLKILESRIESRC